MKKCRISKNRKWDAKEFGYKPKYKYHIIFWKIGLLLEYDMSYWMNNSFSGCIWFVLVASNILLRSAFEEIISERSMYQRIENVSKVDITIYNVIIIGVSFIWDIKI